MTGCIVGWAHTPFGKLDGETLKGGAPALTPGWTLDLMAKHSLDFWLTSEDLPDPNNNLTLDCTINSIDLSLIESRIGFTDISSLNIADVNYDSIVNGNDIAKVVNTLSIKPDDD